MRSEAMGQLRELFTGYDKVNKLQKDIMLFVDWWVREQKTPVPRAAIIKEMKARGTKDFTTINALNSLLKKGYIRRAYTGSNVTKFTQLRRV